MGAVVVEVVVVLEVVVRVVVEVVVVVGGTTACSMTVTADPFVVPPGPAAETWKLSTRSIDDELAGIAMECDIAHLHENVMGIETKAGLDETTHV